MGTVEWGEPLCLDKLKSDTTDAPFRKRVFQAVW